MVENTYNIKLNTQGETIGNKPIEVYQNDHISFMVKLFNDDEIINGINYTYTLISVLQDGEKIIRNGIINDIGFPIFKLGSDEMRLIGNVKAYVQAFDELGNRITSYEFSYTVKEDVSTDGVVKPVGGERLILVGENLLSNIIKNENDNKAMAILAQQELDAMKTDTDGVTHLTPNDRLVSDYNKINSELGNKADDTSVYTKTEVDNLLSYKLNAEVILKNELLNSNFKEGILHFIVYGGTFSTSNNGIIISSAKADNSVLAQVKDIRDNNKYYMLSTFKVLDSNVTTVQIRAYTYTINAINSPELNIKQIISGVYTGNSSHTDVRIRTSYTIGEGRQIIEIYNMLFVNLTLIFGAGNEPTKEEMDTLINILGGWFDGEITVTQKQYVTWLLNLMRQNRNAILALGGTIV